MLEIDEDRVVPSRLSQQSEFIAGNSFCSECLRVLAKAVSDLTSCTYNTNSAFGYIAQEIILKHAANEACHRTTHYSDRA